MPWGFLEYFGSLVHAGGSVPGLVFGKRGKLLERVGTWCMGTYNVPILVSICI